MTWLAWVVIGLGAAGVAGAVIVETLNTKKKQKAEAAAKAETSTENPEQ
jgi:mannose/fructose/N-acetylgalactosamine-specific phosphotransferase system component IIC